ncbi:cbb3-type cytochrome oxidase assembly protein CcoS [Effusibacillus dendaii]|uniref:Cbb3-type cytochrome oxidase assembly protein CcoS n=1 Tax=Effusibacillus dendaii TaxID=2743772 RepID=A0A7I8DHI8_9BACL|nr:cbb3-type cytochrome oxidase assembly protein CcoS [Effusibacillus dendaii]BCJ88479.1 hypothetical protein skT53_34640 [Effusibacillus dendaii]
MTIQAWILLIVMLSMSFSAGAMFYWAKKGGQFKDTESIKYRMLKDHEREGY